MMRRALLALGFLASLAPAFAQAPPPVPALPDSERRTSYSVTGTTCACSVGFALYGDSTDYQSWVEVYLNGALVNYNDPTFGWTITSPTGPLATIPRPVTDAVLTFNSVQTGTVQIVGARRPRRTILFQENRGVAARDLNQGLNDIYAMTRETWDKINDVTGRALISQPGNTLGLLPTPAACANEYLAFDSSGLNPICRPGTFLPPSDITAHSLTLSGMGTFNGGVSITNGGAPGQGLLDILDNGTIGATSTDFVFRAREFEAFNITSGTFTPFRFATQRNNGGIGNRQAVIVGQFGGNAISTEFMSGGEAIAQATAGMTNNSGNWTGWNPVCSLPSGMDASVSCTGQETDLFMNSNGAAKVGHRIVDISSTGTGSIFDAAEMIYKGSSATGFLHGIHFGQTGTAQFPVKSGGTLIWSDNVPAPLFSAIDFHLIAQTFTEAAMILPAARGDLEWGISGVGGRISSQTTSGGGGLLFTSGTTYIQQNAVNALQVSQTNVTFASTVQLLTVASTTSQAGFNVPQGTAPTTPNNGDVWMTSSGLFYRFASTTHGPL